MTITVQTYPDTEVLAAAAADRLVGTIQTAVTTRGRALIVLTGGGTGIGLLRHVADHGSAIDWPKVQVFFGDDRYVPADDADRNAKQANEALLSRVDIPAGNVHAMPASDGEFGDDLDVAALAYERVLAAYAEPGKSAPEFDVHLLGMGGEGHINSLFPETPAVREASRLVLPIYDSPKPPPRRITLTLPAVRHARQVWLVVSGSGKADAVAAALDGADPVMLPAAGAVGTEHTVWLLDHDAAAKRPKRP